MIREFFAFELNFQRKSWLYWLIAAVMMLLALAASSSDAVVIGGAVGNVQRNAPLVIITTLSVLSLLGMFVTVVFIASPLLRDAELGSADMVFSKPFAPAQSVIGRFLAGIVMCTGIYVLVALTIFLGTLAPWVDHARIGPQRLAPYLFGLLVVAIPNVIFLGAVFAALAVRFRSLMAVYVGVIALFVGWYVAGSLLKDIDNTWIATLADPFGVRALSRGTRYWSAAQTNSALPTIFGYLGANRLLWLAVSGALFGYALWGFSPTARASAKREKTRAIEVSSSAPAVALAALARPQSFGSRWPAIWSIFKLDTRFVLFGFPFIAMLLFGMINFYGAARSLSDLFGTHVLPVSYIMVEAIQGGLQWLLAIIVTFYAGELVWRARSAKSHEIIDAMPIKNDVPLLAKIASIVVVIVVFSVIAALAGTLFQMSKGYSHFEPWVYFSGLLISSIPYVLMGLLAITLQVITGNKFLGYGAILLVIVSQISFSLLNLGHNLLVFGGTPSATYSDMNGWGASIPGIAWFAVYWLAFVAVLFVLATVYSTRGVMGSFAERTRMALAALRGRTGIALVISSAAFVSTGAWLFHQTNQLNSYLSPKALLDQRADYEKRFRALETTPQPRVIAANINVDIFPRTLSMRAKGTLTLENRSGKPITQFIVQSPRDVELKLRLPPNRISVDEKNLNLTVYALSTPMAPGQRIDLPFTSAISPHGIRNDGVATKIVDNGTFFNNNDFLPSFGYEPLFEINDANERRKRGLGEARRMPKLEDEAARINTYIASDSDWIQFETTVSTDVDQIALSPGYLQREWTQGDRRYFHYKMDRPILNFYSYLSARWQVTKGDWHGLPIEIYHHPSHDKNVAAMIKATQKSLDYFSKNFGPYQHKQVRIVEFPRYAQFAQSFPNTIPFSEAIGFIADVRGPDAIDYPFYVTAHEVAHQWWAHQVIGANVQGSTILSETLAQYSALMVMEHEYGPQKMRKFLSYELDNYLRSRRGELIEEQPLYRVENQPYVHYRKGSLVFYRLKDELGEEAVNAALAELVKTTAYQPAPFPTSKNLLALLRAHAPADKQALITDLFEKICFYDNRLTSASAKKLADGRYAVTLKLIAQKFYADGKGEETPAALGESIDVAVFARGNSDKEDDQKILYLAKQPITAAEQTLTIIVTEKPTQAGFDPYNKLIDRVSKDNRLAVTVL
jgi:ABC-2 type transport system permease protein